MNLVERQTRADEEAKWDPTQSGKLVGRINEAVRTGDFELAGQILEQSGDMLNHGALEQLVDEIVKQKRAEGTVLSDSATLSAGRLGRGIRRAQEKEWFFIVGCPKSGTTWLQNIVNGHPNIWCSGEQNLKKLAEMLEQAATSYNKDVAEINDGHIGQGDAYLMFDQTGLRHVFIHMIQVLFGSALTRIDVGCVGAKNPDLVTALDLFGELLPKAKFIHMIRDGRDVAVSGWFHNQRMDTHLKAQHLELSTYVESCAKFWNGAIHSARRFGHGNPGRYLEIRYEDLHEKPGHVIRNLLEFLGVNASETFVELCRLAGGFERVSGGRHRGQEDGRSFFRKGITGDWRNHFDESCSNAFAKHGEGLLRQLGYE
ncbi:MAG: sulfotransferase domain-containing protein [Deltaproteobacteria bacterium]|nr:sulfotransferase domain-containing protein [Deltaproteobacteria bacterium]